MFKSAELKIASFCLEMVWGVDRNPLTLPSILGALNAPSLRGRCLQSKPQKRVLLLVREDGLACSALSDRCLLLSGTKAIAINLWLLQNSCSDCAIKQHLVHQSAQQN